MNLISKLSNLEVKHSALQMNKTLAEGKNNLDHQIDIAVIQCTSDLLMEKKLGCCEENPHPSAPCATQPFCSDFPLGIHSFT